MLALIGLRASKELLQRNLAIIEANIEAFTAFCVHHKDVLEFCAPAAGSIAFARLLTGEPIEAFCERLVAEHGEASGSVTLCSLWLQTPWGRVCTGLHIVPLIVAVADV